MKWSKANKLTAKAKNFMQINSACSSHSNISMKPISAVIELLFAACFSPFTFPISLRLSCTHNTVELSHLRATQQVPRLVSRFRVRGCVWWWAAAWCAEEFLLMIANRMSWPSRRRRVWGAKRSENRDQFSADLLPPPPQRRFARNFFLRQTLVSSTLNQWSLGSREEWMNSKNFLSRFLFWVASSKILGSKNGERKSQQKEAKHFIIHD